MVFSLLARGSRTEVGASDLTRLGVGAPRIRLLSDPQVPLRGDLALLIPLLNFPLPRGGAPRRIVRLVIPPSPSRHCPPDHATSPRTCTTTTPVRRCQRRLGSWRRNRHRYQRSPQPLGPAAHSPGQGLIGQRLADLALQTLIMASTSRPASSPAPRPSPPHRRADPTPNHTGLRRRDAQQQKPFRRRAAPAAAGPHRRAWSSAASSRRP